MSRVNALLFALGIKTTATITAPLTKIVEDLQALASHKLDEMRAITTRQAALAEQIKLADRERVAALRQMELVRRILA